MARNTSFTYNMETLNEEAKALIRDYIAGKYTLQQMETMGFRLTDYGDLRYDPRLAKKPLSKDRPKGDDRYKIILDMLWEMHCKKGKDYGSDDDFLANLRASEQLGIPAWVGALVRANDKMIRLSNAAKGQELANESVEDSLMDLASYAILSLILFQEGHNEKGN